MSDSAITETGNCPLTPPGKPGDAKFKTHHPSPAITVALVKRVSKRISTGVPPDLALAGELVSRSDYQEHLSKNPELAALEQAAKREFLQSLIGMLLEAKDSSANIRWLLERIYPEIFSRNRKNQEAIRGDDGVKRGISPIVGVSEEEYLAMVESAAKL